MSKISWTKSQAEAIHSRGDVQVAASAGTGKTAVLSRRCIDLLLEENNKTDIDQILVLTFTEDAAAEMRQRIARELKAESRNKASASRLQRQLMRIDIADISTIHSFCRKIVANNFHSLAIDPGFSIIDEDEQKLLRSEILTDVIEQAWQDKSLSANLRDTLEGRNPDLKKGILKNILNIDVFLSSLIEPQKWIDLSLSGNVEYRYLSDILIEKINICRALSKQAQVLDKQLLGGFYAENISQFNDNLDAFEKGVNCGDRAVIEQAIEIANKTKFRPKPRNTEDADYLTARSPITEIAKKKILKKLSEDIAPYALLDKLKDCQATDTGSLLTITQMFRSEYQKRKSDLKCLDFNDLERLALKALTNDDGSASDIAKQMQQDYKYVFVDEYQDVNKIQDRIIQLVSRGENLFVVGDVKQSIYSWRQAMPEIFLERIRNAEQSGSKNIYLNENFRCRSGIIDFTNSVFSEIMNSDVAGMDYSENAELVLGATWYKRLDEVCNIENSRCCELHIITSGDKDVDQADEQDEQAESSNSNQRQAVLIAQRIRKLVGDKENASELKIIDGQGNLRNVEYGDIVILMRSLKNKVNDYVDVLRQHNIPVEASVTGNYFESPEVNDCLSVLKVLDNPIRDIEFAAVMRSPLFGFSDSELLEIRNFVDDSSKPFYCCACEYVGGGVSVELAGKITRLLDTLEDWRIAASSDNLAHLVWNIILHNDFLSFATALPGGLQRRADLLKLYERAIQFDGFLSAQGNPSLARFVDFIERLRESDTDWSQAETEAPQGSSVRIMSIHKSKGLEFPVVFMPAIEGKFNTADTKEICLLDEELPIGLRVYLSNTGKQYSTDCFNIIKHKKLTDSVAEQMRTLYVAMTRAREKLILVGDSSKKKQSEDLNNLQQRLGEIQNLSDRSAFNWWLSDCGSRSYLDWFIASMREQDGIFKILETGGKLNDVEIFITPCDKLQTDAQTLMQSEQGGQDDFDEQLIGKLQERIDKKYRYEALLSLPVKNSVSAITHRDDEFKVDYFTKSFSVNEIFEKPQEGVEPRLIGTATHLVFEKLPLDKKPQAIDVQQVIDNLKKQGVILPQVAELINIEEVLAFFDSVPGKLIFEPEVKVFREYPFTIGLTPAECGFGEQSEMGDNIIVQGVIDLLIQTAEGFAIVDFKTDNVSAENISRRAEIYQTQLRLYSYAVSKIEKKGVFAKWLYFLKPKQIYEC